MILNYHTQRVMEEHNRKIAKVTASKKSTSKEAQKKRLEAMLRIFQETRRQLRGRR